MIPVVLVPLTRYRLSRAQARPRCYNCNKLGHYSRDCRAPKTESRGEKPKVSAKQVTVTTTNTNADDPYSFHSDSGDQVNLVTVTDQGSKPRRAKVMVQGVYIPAYGVVDTGADITIMGLNSLPQSIT